MKQEVHKFGGAIVGTPEGIKQIVEIVKGKDDRQLFVILSAASGVTDLLIKITTQPLDDVKINELINKLGKIHYSLLENVNIATLDGIEDALLHLRGILNGVILMGKFNQHSINVILSFGEKIAVHLIQSQLQAEEVSSVILKPENIFITVGDLTDAYIDFTNSDKRLTKALEHSEKSLVYLVPGYYAQNKEGDTTIFGRSGSDYTATSIANLLDITQIYIWKNVNGFMTSDPRIVSNARTIEELTYNQAIDLSGFGAQILQAKASLPTRKKQIPIWIANINNSEQITKIHDFADIKPRIVAITNLENVVVVSMNSRKSNYFAIQDQLTEIIKEQFDKIVFVQSTQTSSYFILKKQSNRFQERAKEFTSTMGLEITIVEGRGLITMVGVRIDIIPNLEMEITQFLEHNSIQKFSPFLISSDISIGFLVNQDSIEQTVNLLHEKFIVN